MFNVALVDANQSTAIDGEGERRVAPIWQSTQLRVRRRNPPARARRRLRDQAEASGERPSDCGGGSAPEIRSMERRGDGGRPGPSRSARSCLAGSARRGQKDRRRRGRQGGQASAAPLKPAAAGPDAGKLQLPDDRARQGKREGKELRKFQAFLLLCRSGGRPADDRQADGKPAPRRTVVGRRRSEPHDLPRKPGPWRRGAADRLRRRSQTEHGGGARTDRSVSLAAGDSVAAERREAQRVRADSGGFRTAAAMSESEAGLLADPTEVRAI